MNDIMNPDEETLRQKVLYLAEVEKLTGKQIQQSMKIGYRRLKKIMNPNYSPNPRPATSCVEPFRELIVQWHKEHPNLKAIQFFERLKTYGYKNSRSTIERFTKQFRQKKHKAYNALIFHSGQEAQVDWFYFKTPKLGTLFGFVYLLSWSRYAWGRFYPKATFEFFIQGHLDAFEHLKGLPRTGRYDNLKSVVIKRNPEIQYNAAFLEFARHYGFAIHACNPNSGNEKGRVERIIRDIRVWLSDIDPESIEELNDVFFDEMIKRNQKVHRVTGKIPLHLLADEKLMMLPLNAYPARRILSGKVSKTCLVEFETNWYSVPSSCASKACQITAYPQRIEIHVGAGRIASHKRSFKRKQVIQNPLHSEKLLKQCPQFKMKRILDLIYGMDLWFRSFLDAAENPKERMDCAYQIFILLKTHSRSTLTSAIRELVRMKTFKIKALRSLLRLPSVKEERVIRPQDDALLDIRYEQRSLKDYDPT